MTKAELARQYLKGKNFDTTANAHKSFLNTTGLTMHYSQFRSIYLGVVKMSKPVLMPQKTIHVTPKKNKKLLIFHWNKTEVGSTERLQDVKNKCLAAMQYHGLIDNGWTAKWGKGVRTLGMCRYRRKEIAISKRYALHSSLEAIEDTILHEIAHALDFRKYGYSNHHGPKWQQIAKSIGCSGKRCKDSKQVKVGKILTHVYKCPNCGDKISTLRKIRVETACGPCCDRHNYGQYSDNFKLIYKGAEIVDK